MHAICEIKQKIITIDMQLAVLYRCKTVAARIMMLKPPEYLQGNGDNIFSLSLILSD